VERQIHLRVKTDLNACEQVLAWFEQLNQPPLPDPQLWWKCQTLLQEGLTNAIEHAHRTLSPETPIDLEASRSDEAIAIRIYDFGMPFDLDRQLRQTPDFDENQRARGRGLRIMSMIADRLSYTRTSDKRNCLNMIKYY
jgi:serine/threonine-protein kinase RsbW